MKSVSALLGALALAGAVFGNLNAWAENDASAAGSAAAPGQVSSTQAETKQPPAAPTFVVAQAKPDKPTLSDLRVYPSF